MPECTKAHLYSNLEFQFFRGGPHPPDSPLSGEGGRKGGMRGLGKGESLRRGKGNGRDGRKGRDALPQTIHHCFGA